MVKQSGSDKAGGSSKGKDQNGRSLLDRWNKLSPALRFLVSFVVVMIVFYIFYYSPLYENYLMNPLLNIQARISNVLLNIMGQGTSVHGDIIASDDFSVSIKGGCDGVEATALFLVAILVFPLSFRLKWPGILLGLAVLSILNIIRIAGLYLAGIYWPAAFEFLHLHGGVVVFTIIAIMLWMIWINWALKQKIETGDV